MPISHGFLVAIEVADEAPWDTEVAMEGMMKGISGMGFVDINYMGEMDVVDMAEPLLTPSQIN
jgi:hypothetical protein